MNPIFYREVTNSNKQWFSKVDPSVQFKGTARIGRNVIIEEGCIIGDQVFIGHNVKIRPESYFGDYAELRADVWVSDFARIGHHTAIFNRTNIVSGMVVENYVYVGIYVSTANVKDVVRWRERDTIKDPPYVKNGARIMAGTILLPGVTIGRNSLIGAGSLVTRNVPNGEIWYGHPARKRGLVDPDDIPIGMLEKISLSQPVKTFTICGNCGGNIGEKGPLGCHCGYEFIDGKWIQTK